MILWFGEGWEGSVLGEGSVEKDKTKPTVTGTTVTSIWSFTVRQLSCGTWGACG